MECSPPSGEGSVNLTRSKTKELWDMIMILTLIILSLGAQTILTIFGNRRRYRLSYFNRFSVWLSYLMASPVVTLALGKLSGASESLYEENQYIQQQHNSTSVFVLYTFSWWAPLFLVQIGSPNILFYSVEDNKLKLRQVVGLTSQVAIALWILYNSWYPGIYLYAAVLPLYVAGIIKVIDTLRALRSLSDSENVVINTLKDSDIQKVVIPN
ncbi:hypothetical protein Patl1_14479 [Pistacia atlantica]|uniref:Uncharacterized protein n=1 Tax=Pistacia atlantica TaxID=434234 RepID=A0ACC1AUL7_9ROSI|nr:hypothetical protein Patl1_14479 [Pistacia atlantica]